MHVSILNDSDLLKRFIFIHC